MALKPWYTVIFPREDLRQGKPLDASEFAVHLDRIRDGRAPRDYQDPEQFFSRTYLTQNLKGLATEVVRRLSGESTETSAVFNLATQFGGGKTHALTLLYHLVRGGAKARNWPGVNPILTNARVDSIPQAATAVFVGTEFDSLTGRGGNDGTPLRKTPWGEIAFQLGGEEAFAKVAEHEANFIEPKGDVIRAFLPKDRPCLILLDEIINYVSTYRRLGYHNSFYNFLQALSEVARSEERVVLVVSIPASELEYTSEDEADEQRFKKMLDRLGKAFIMSAKSETSEIIRRRLFEWEGLPDDSHKVITAYTDWIVAHRYQLPSWFPVDQPQEALAATYPLHPMVISVFERKWQDLPRFQQTRGVLRLLALWVSRAYQEGFNKKLPDPLIGPGTAPLEDPLFRAAVFEQLGHTRLEASVTTDICGKEDSHAVSLDKHDVETIKNARLHQKVATVIFFESNGGQSRPEATLPEIRLAVGEPGLDIGNIETVLEALSTTAYYLSYEGNHYRFSPSPNLNKIFADRRASVPIPRIKERLQEEVRDSFPRIQGLEFCFFPERNNQIPDQPAITFVITSPDQPMQEPMTLELIEAMTREYGTRARRFKNALVWIIAEDNGLLKDAARKALAWEKVDEEKFELRLNDTQKTQLSINLKNSKRDLGESVWRSYKKVALLHRDNSIRVLDLGLVHSSAADSLPSLILDRLKREGDIEDTISPNFLVRHWPPALQEWNTKAVRDAFFASPQFPRLLFPEKIRDTIVRGVTNGFLAYVSKGVNGGYEIFRFNEPLSLGDVEVAEDVYIISRETAEQHLHKNKKYETDNGGETAVKEPKPSFTTKPTGETEATSGTETDYQESETEKAQSNLLKGVTHLTWNGEISPQKWVNFYMKVLTKFVSKEQMTLTLHVDVSDGDGISQQKIAEMKAALEELGLDSTITTDC